MISFLTFVWKIAALIAEGHNLGRLAPVVYVSGEEVIFYFLILNCMLSCLFLLSPIIIICSCAIDFLLSILSFTFFHFLFLFLKPNRVWGFYNLISTLGNLCSFILIGFLICSLGPL
jgi:hypothetical protein